MTINPLGLVEFEVLRYSSNPAHDCAAGHVVGPNDIEKHVSAPFLGWVVKLYSVLQF